MPDDPEFARFEWTVQVRILNEDGTFSQWRESGSTSRVRDAGDLDSHLAQVAHWNDTHHITEHRIARRPRPASWEPVGGGWDDDQYRLKLRELRRFDENLTGTSGARDQNPQESA